MGTSEPSSKVDVHPAKKLVGALMTGGAIFCGDVSVVDTAFEEAAKAGEPAELDAKDKTWLEGVEEVVDIFVEIGASFEVDGGDPGSKVAGEP